jgi:uncharacterized repeat protein (TIGR03803 family)
VLYSFCSQPSCSDGNEPEGGLIAHKDGALYGTTASGGGTCGCGTVFKLTPPAKGQTAWTETVLYSFKGGAGGDGTGPVGSLIADKDGALYGTTFGSMNPNLGIAFKLTPPAEGQTAWTETVLCTLFGNSNAGLIAHKGVLYGTTFQGPGAGGVFKLTPPAEGQTAWTETELYTFKGGSDGASPNGGLIPDERGALYGATNSGGNNGTLGTVFKLTPPAEGQTAWTETQLYAFKGGSDGAMPYAGLTVGKEHVLYGTTEGGGGALNEGYGFGTFFKLTLSP